MIFHLTHFLVVYFIVSSTDVVHGQTTKQCLDYDNSMHGTIDTAIFDNSCVISIHVPKQQFWDSLNVCNKIVAGLGSVCQIVQMKTTDDIASLNKTGIIKPTDKFYVGIIRDNNGAWLWKSYNDTQPASPLWHSTAAANQLLDDSALTMAAYMGGDGLVKVSVTEFVPTGFVCQCRNPDVPILPVTSAPAPNGESSSSAASTAILSSAAPSTAASNSSSETTSSWNTSATDPVSSSEATTLYPSVTSSSESSAFTSPATNGTSTNAHENDTSSSTNEFPTTATNVTAMPTASNGEVSSTQSSSASVTPSTQSTSNNLTIEPSSSSFSHSSMITSVTEHPTTMLETIIAQSSTIAQQNTASIAHSTASVENSNTTSPSSWESTSSTPNTTNATEFTDTTAGEAATSSATEETSTALSTQSASSMNSTQTELPSTSPLETTESATTASLPMITPSVTANTTDNNSATLIIVVTTENAVQSSSTSEAVATESVQPTITPTTPSNELPTVPTTAQSQLECGWHMTNGAVNISSITTANKGAKANNPDQCRTFCNMKMIQNCAAYAFTTTISMLNGFNCILFPPLPSSTYQTGDFDLYQNGGNC
uniref:C-type lectin domain-containing protein n=1 Tax=Plectus sambesii TaxID=2011161 RepID=A0A914WWT9_9BILA